MKPPRSRKKPGPAPPAGPAAGTPFDLWLQRGLHTLFDEVASEPIPDELLKLIEDDRNDTNP